MSNPSVMGRRAAKLLERDYSLVEVAHILDRHPRTVARDLEVHFSERRTEAEAGRRARADARYLNSLPPGRRTIERRASRAWGDSNEPSRRAA